METRPLDSPSELQGPGRLLRWLVAEGSKVRYGESVAECSAELNEGHFSVVSPFSGVLKRKLVGVGESFGVGAPLGELSVCKHPAFFRDLCVSCGVHMSKTPSGEEGGAATLISTTTKERVILSGGHTITLTDGEAREMKDLLADGLIKQRKLALILDLDNTLIHAHPVPREPTVVPGDMFMVSLRHGGREDHHLVQRRHMLHEFLTEAGKLFQLSVYTHGLRNYAEGIVSNIDPEGVFFGHRIVSWSDVPGVKDHNSRKYGKKSLENMFLDDWSRVLVMDDREDVWMTGTQHKHLLLVKPFVYSGFREFLHMMEKTQHEAVVLQEERTEGMPPPETNRNLEKSPEEEVESEVCWSADKSDGQLMRCLDLLMHIHKTYYDQLDASPGLKRMIKVESDPSPALSTACILGAMKSQILCGCVVAFSCIFPNQFDQAKIERQPLWRQACDLGAIVEHGVNPHTTHLITMQPATNKAKMCFAMKSVSVVHPDWLLDCLWNVRRAAEATYAMGPMPTLDPPPYLPSTMEAVASNDSDSIDLKRRRIDKSTEDVDNETWGSCGVTAGGDSDSDEEWMRSMEDEVADALG